MDKKKIRNFQIFSAIFTFVLGTILHFLYKWTGENHIVALFSSLNESVWEHLKLAYFPMMLTILIGYFYLGHNSCNFLCSKTIGILVAMVAIVTFFYTYTGVLGKNIPVIDISSFYISTLIGEFIAYLLMINKYKCNNLIASIILIIIFISFIIFTYNTPNLGIFKDPITGQYGIM